MLRPASLVHAVLIASNYEIQLLPEITRRRTGEFLRELFSILLAAPEGMRASDAL